MTDNEKIASELRAIAGMVEDAYKALDKLASEFEALYAKHYVGSELRTLDVTVETLRHTAAYVLAATAEDFHQPA